MWLVTVGSTVEFDALCEAFGYSESDAKTTPTGARVAFAPEPDPRPTVGLVGDDPAANRRLLEWGQSQRGIHGVVTSGLALSCGAAADPGAVLIPTHCYRAVGRIEPNGGPLLYEELPFDSALQAKLAEALSPGDTLDRRPLFGAPRTIGSAEVRDWVGAKLGCPALDGHSGDIHVFGRNLGLPVASFKLVASPEGQRRLRTLWKNWATRYVAPPAT